MGVLVIAAYRPKPGRQDELLALTKTHVAKLRALGLATDRPATAALAADGTVIEIFEWRDGGIEAAHEHPEVHAIWAEYAVVCDYVPLTALAETQALFAAFTPLDF